MTRDFRHLTVVAVTGKASDVSAAALAVVHSSQALPGSRALFVSPVRPPGLPAWMRHVEIEPFGYLEYSLFVVYALHQLIETEFALLVQDDGWVLNARNWRDEYLDYDYIGAPSHLARITRPERTEYCSRFGWVEDMNHSCDRIDIVYNGGFSLRSKKLLRAPAEQNLPYCIPPADFLRGKPLKMAWHNDAPLEDVQLCGYMRSALERSGVRFAPLRVARQFSVELMHPVLHDGLDLTTVFGHHLRFRRLTSLTPRRVTYSIGREQAERLFGEAVFARALEFYGYCVE